MKLGTENKKKTAIAVGLLIVAVLLVARTLFSGPSAPAAAPKTGGARSAAQTPGGAQGASTDQASQRRATTDRTRYLSAVLAPTLDPRLRFDLLKSSEEVKYEGTGRNIFSAQSAPEIPKAVEAPRQDLQTAVPQGPPPPPPINLKFFGYATRSGEPRKIFLVQGDNVFPAREGDIVAGRYRIVKINPLSVEIQDVLSNNTQTIPLTQG